MTIPQSIAVPDADAETATATEYRPTQIEPTSCVLVTLRCAGGVGLILAAVLKSKMLACLSLALVLL